MRSHREALGISQEELGLRADVHRTYVSDIERGSRNPTIEVIHVLTKALECSLEALMADVTRELERR